jgi:putative exosortase-associated protein (TIGR04073 family)
MKNLVVVFFIIGLIFSFTLPVHANGPVKKLGRGVANVVTSPFELPKGMGDAKAETGVFAGLTWGIVQGTVNVVKRAVVGVYEIATFPVPLPKDYEPILEDPEFFLQKDRFKRIK